MRRCGGVKENKTEKRGIRKSYMVNQQHIAVYELTLRSSSYNISSTKSSIYLLIYVAAPVILLIKVTSRLFANSSFLQEGTCITRSKQEIDYTKEKLRNIVEKWRKRNNSRGARSRKTTTKTRSC